MKRAGQLRVAVGDCPPSLRSVWHSPQNAGTLTGRSATMSLFDWYLPHSGLSCSECGTELETFQGKDGACCLLVWRQGAASPVEQRVDDDLRLGPAALEGLRLPALFEFHSKCSSCGALSTFTGRAESGVWVDVLNGSHLHAGAAVAAYSVASDRRRCSACTREWQHPDSASRAGCPNCGAVTRLEPS
jgi:hypothetical protein